MSDGTTVGNWRRFVEEGLTNPGERAVMTAAGVYARTHGVGLDRAIDAMADDLGAVMHDALEPGLPDQTYVCTPEETATFRACLDAVE
jgi:hypothetical protein